MDFLEFIKPELVIVAIVCYFIGMALKNTIKVKDKFIPLILGGAGILICTIWVLANSPLDTFQDWLMAIFAGLTQGVLVAGTSTYVNQLIKQLSSKE